MRGPEFLKRELRHSYELMRLFLLVIVPLLGVLAFLFLFFIFPLFPSGKDPGGAGTQLRQTLQERIAERVGGMADARMQEMAVNTPELSNQLIPVPDTVQQLAGNVYQAGGVANTQLIATADGNVVFDTGLAIQGAKQKRLLQEMAPGRTAYIVLSHSHSDHIGGARFWQEEGTEIVAHREFPEEQRYLDELEPYLHKRNRAMFPWLPKNPPRNRLFRYGGVEPTILVDNGKPYRFTLGGVQFEAIATPGAEGADNLCLWLPGQKILFSGDTLGPIFPQFPNLVTLRGEKMRKPIEYIHSLNLLIDLEPELLVPSHHGAVRGREKIRTGLERIRDAVQYVHDQTVQGMNEGSTVYQLMEEIQLPPHLALNQTHGKVSWGVRGIWEYYSTWFHFDATADLYPVPMREVYADLTELSGAQALVDRAADHLRARRPVHALRLLEVALGGETNYRPALQLRLDALQTLLVQAEEGLRVGYEMSWLKQRIAHTQEQLGAP